MSSEIFCPFAKAIFSGCCQCHYANKYDQRTRRINCNAAEEIRPYCIDLNNLLLSQYFVLDLETGQELGFTQKLKLLCGGLAGIQRINSKTNDTPPNVAKLVEENQISDGNFDSFPFNQIAEDIQGFQSRKRRSK